MTTMTKSTNGSSQNFMSLIQDKDQPYYHILRWGILTGITLLFVGVIGMLEAFHNREVIRSAPLFGIEISTLTLGQLTLFVPAFFGGYLAAKKIKEQHNLGFALVAGVLVGILCALPTIILVWFNNWVDVRNMFVNVNRDWLEIVTFDRRDELVMGSLLLSGALALSGFLGAGLQLLQDKIRQSILYGLGLMLTIGIMGQTVAFLLQEIFPDDFLKIFFQRDTLLPATALGLFIIGAVLVGLPEKIRRSVIFGLLVALAVEGVLTLIEAAASITLPFASNNNLSVFTYFVVPFLLGFAGRMYVEYTSVQILRNPTAEKTNAGAKASTPLNRLDLIVLVIILLVAPWLVGRALSDVMVTIGIFVLMGLGLNIAIGLAGLLDLGYVTNYAVGAYVLAVMTSTGPLGLFNGGGLLDAVLGNFWVVIPIALLAAMLAGFIFAVPVLKMRGDYLAIATLGFGEIIGRLAVSDALAPIIGGAQGMSFIPKPNFFGIEMKDPEQLYYIILAACFVTLLVSIRLNNSRTGRQWMAIREDEDVAAAMGINVAQAKLLAFTLSAATGGVAGAIFAAKVGTVFPNSFLVFVSINVLSLIIVGGMGSNPGIVVGAIVLIGLPELLREFSDFRWLMYGVLLIWMMINRPEGLWPSEVRVRELAGNDPPPAPDTEAPVVVTE